MIAYGSSETNPCGCPDKQPFCTTCNTRCDKKIDASCAVYHLLEPNAINHLTCLGLPNGVTVEQFMEAVDAAICAGINVTPLIFTVDTPSIDLTGNGTLLTPLQADAIISPDSGNNLSIRLNGLYATGGLPADICPSIPTTFVTDTNQKNAVAQTNYDFLISGAAGCQRISPPLGFAVSGPNRKSAFGAMEWYITLTAANTAALAGETVLLYTDAVTENIAAKNNVNYAGIGTAKILNFTAASVKSDLSNIVITGALTVSGTSKCVATNVSIYGLSQFSSTANWRGGSFFDDTTIITITNSARVSNIYSEKRIAVAQNSTLTDFNINYISAFISPVLDINVTGDFRCRVTRGNVFALDNTSGLGAVFAYVSGGSILILDSIVSESDTSNAIYLQCGDQQTSATLIASNLTGRSQTGNGIRAAGSQPPLLVGNSTSVLIDHCSGFSEDAPGIVTINANLKHCSGYSINSSGILIGGSENPGQNINIIECIGESLRANGLKCEKDVYISGGTYISRLSSSDASAIYITTNAVTENPLGARAYFICGVKTITTHNTAYAIKAQSAGLLIRISGNDFINPLTTSPVLGIDPLISVRITLAEGPPTNGNRR